MILRAISKHWWVLTLRGVAAILFGLCALFWPALTLAVLVLLWGAYSVIDGIMAVVAGISGRWWSLVFFGLIAIAAGLFAIVRPGITGLVLILVMAAWTIVRGIFEIAAAVRLRKELANEWLLIVSGILSIALGILVVMFPGAGILSIIWLIAAYALIIGALLVILSFRLRRLHRMEPRRAS
ncbi:MAG TPA: HdeD family acid-resistance protein [Bryobacteraceae bacterium]|nr:HdeD family acid-resistance protein [Bryobacteraceae bacterium]